MESVGKCPTIARGGWALLELKLRVKNYFVFNVLPFGLSTAPYIFTKLLKPLIGHWRGSGKRICMFLDDGLGGNSSKESATVDAKAVKEDLGQLGFVLSENKCFWEPPLTQTWLGHVFNMSENLFVRN